MKKKTILILAGTIIIMIAASGFMPSSKTMNPEKWIKVTVTDTTNVPISQYNELVGKVSLEKAAGDRKYDNLPRIQKTKNIVGDFSHEGHSRVVYFSSGDTLVETIIAKKEPFLFGYEITKASLPMRRVAFKARGVFERHEIEGTKTVTVWTYSFQHKNFVSKLLINRYINSTHRQWMKDMLRSTKDQIETAYVADKKPYEVKD